jgi:hypothetical protein
MRWVDSLSKDGKRKMLDSSRMQSVVQALRHDIHHWALNTAGTALQVVTKRTSTDGEPYNQGPYPCNQGPSDTNGGERTVSAAE